MAKSPAATPSSRASPSPRSPASTHRQLQWRPKSPASSSPSSPDDLRRPGGHAGCDDENDDGGGGVHIKLKSIEHTLLPLVKQVRNRSCFRICPPPPLTTSFVEFRLRTRALHPRRCANRTSKFILCVRLFTIANQLSLQRQL